MFSLVIEKYFWVVFRNYGDISNRQCVDIVAISMMSPGRKVGSSNLGRTESLVANGVRLRLSNRLFHCEFNKRTGRDHFWINICGLVNNDLAGDLGDAFGDPFVDEHLG